jgi:hypothetical protein
MYVEVAGHHKVDFSYRSVVTDLITPPDLNQARVNKCLIALVNRKVVQKDNSTVSLIILHTTAFNQNVPRALCSIIGKEYLKTGKRSTVLIILGHNLPMNSASLVVATLQ